tara:strand:- start:1335 stop:1562 length:228 start_codon:yes stop_codon:yes gene_type:complete
MIENIIIKYIFEVTGKNVDDIGISFTELAIDSLDYAQIVILTEHELNTNVLEKNISWNEIKSIGDLIGVFELNGK